MIITAVSLVITAYSDDTVERNVKVPEVILGALPNTSTIASAANLALPEDAIQLSEGIFIVSDRQNGYLKKLENNQLDVIDIVNSKPSAFSSLIKLSSDEFYSFSDIGDSVAIYHHKLGEAPKQLPNVYMNAGKQSKLTEAKMVQDKKNGFIIFDRTNAKFIQYDNGNLSLVDLKFDFSKYDIMGFDFCGSELIFSSQVKRGGEVIFYKLDKHKNLSELFRDRPYSNWIKCLNNEDFMYGARWELKLYEKKNQKITVLSDDFVHVASIRDGVDTGDFVITDSDKERVSVFNIHSQLNEVVITTENAKISDTIIKLQLLENDTLMGLTADHLFFEYDLLSNQFTLLFNSKGQGKWASFLGGKKFSSLRAFVFDEKNKNLYLASNHGIFLLNPIRGKFKLFAGSEDFYGSDNGYRKDARFAVIRDLLLHNNKLFIADAWNDKIRLIDLTTDLVFDVLGNGKNEFVSSKDKSKQAQCNKKSQFMLNRPLSIVIFNKKLIVANSYSHYLIATSPTSNLQENACVFSGVVQASHTQYGGGYIDGTPKIAEFSGISNIFSTKNYLVISEMWNNSSRIVDAHGNVKTIFKDDTLSKFTSNSIIYNDYLIFASADGTLKKIRIDEL